MAGRQHGPDDDDDAAARYLRRMQGDGATPGPDKPSPAPPLPAASPVAGATGLSSHGDEEPRRSFPGAPPPGWSSSLPKGAPFCLIPADTVLPGSTAEGRQVPLLPTWFLSDGLHMLRKGDYKAAEQYYEALTRKNADEAEGWLGLGAAWQGRGSTSQAVACYVKGLELDEHLFPLAALAVEATPGKPAVLYNLAVALSRQDKRRCYRTAISIFEEVMASATTSRRLYQKADAARRKAKDGLEWLEARENPSMMSLKKTAQRQKRWRTIVHTVFFAVTVTAVTWIGWQAYHRSRAETLYQQGMLTYTQGHRVATYGSSKLTAAEGKDAYLLYTEALDHFRESIRFRPTSFEAHFMIVKAGQQALRHLARHFGSEKTPPELVQQLHSQIEAADAYCRKADPGGHETRRQQGLLDSRLSSAR